MVRLPTWQCFRAGGNDSGGGGKANSDPVISPTFVEANFKTLESLKNDYKRQARDEGLQRDLEYSSEDYDQEIKAEPRPSSNGRTRFALMIGSPIVRRLNGRTFGFEGVSERAPNGVERTTDKRRIEVSNGRTSNEGNEEVNSP
ncbi:hypothetical protein Tco_0527077 [Tanacetum coccineum]